MSEIKLKAKRKDTDDWLLFGITELFHGENGYFRVCVEDVGLFPIDPATIQPADDPRKALREQVKVLREACETAKECLDNNGLGKAYVQDFLNEALSQTKPKGVE